MDAVTEKGAKENVLFPNGPKESTDDHVFPLGNLGYTIYLLVYSCSSLLNVVSLGYDNVMEPPVILVLTSAHSSMATWNY